jgi:hypothetical protein
LNLRNPSGKTDNLQFRSRKPPFMMAPHRLFVQQLHSVCSCAISGTCRKDTILASPLFEVSTQIHIFYSDIFES